MSSVKGLSKSSSLTVFSKVEDLIHTSWYPNLYTAEVELHNNMVTSNRHNNYLKTTPLVVHIYIEFRNF